MFSLKIQIFTSVGHWGNWQAWAAVPPALASARSAGTHCLRDEVFKNSFALISIRRDGYSVTIIQN